MHHDDRTKTFYPEKYHSTEKQNNYTPVLSTYVYRQK